MVIEDTPNNEGGAVMYGVTFDLDTHILEDELGIERKKAYSEIEQVLEGLGYVHVQYSVYVCPNPETPEIAVVYDTIEALKKLPWFGEAVSTFLAFELSSWGELSSRFK